MQNTQPINLSVVIPIHNEAANIEVVISGLKKELADLGLADYEIIAVNDGSIDKTAKILENIQGIKVITHPYNKGMGAAMKTGTKQAEYEWVLFFDADGQHRPEYIKKILDNCRTYDLIAGDRTRGKYVRPLSRKPGLWLLRKIANYLVDYKIPDLNCGMRLFKKNVLMNYLHLMPNGFSMSTTSTLAFLKDRRNVKFVPIKIDKRGETSKSTVKPRDAAQTLMLIFRLIMLFSPLRIFLPISIILFLAGLAFLVQGLVVSLNISDVSVLFLISSILIFFFGLIADQTACLRREVNRHDYN